MVCIWNVLKHKCLEITAITIKIPFCLLHLTLT